MKRKNIVTIGGGTGSFMLLTGLRKYPVNLTAIVSMADDGGSTGVLRDELGVLPPGDVRQCLVALSNSSQKLRDIFNYRFESGGLKGHNFGNLFLSVLEKTSGSFTSGIEEASKILNVKGDVIPATDKAVKLYLKLKDNTVLKGENEIYESTKIEKGGFGKMYLKPDTKANSKAIQKIIEAQYIIIGPGDLYASILPVLLVKGISQAIQKSSAKVIYNVNLINKKGQTEKFRADDYVDKINQFLGSSRIDYAVINKKEPPKYLLSKYVKKGGGLVKFNVKDRKKREYKILNVDVLSGKIPKYSIADKLSSSRSFIRHDSNKLASNIILLTQVGEHEKLLKRII